MHAGEPVLGQLLPELRLKPGDQVWFKPFSLKHNLYPEKMVVTMTGDHRCAITRLHALLKQSDAAAQPIVQFLCRPLASNKQQFLEQPLSVAAFEEDVSTHFIAAGIPYHATLHGSRRGSLQEGAAQGLSQAEVGLLGQIKTPRVQAMYLDAARHLPGVLKKGPRPNKRPRLGEFALLQTHPRE